MVASGQGNMRRRQNFLKVLCQSLTGTIMPDARDEMHNASKSEERENVSEGLAEVSTTGQCARASESSTTASRIARPCKKASKWPNTSFADSCDIVTSAT